MSKLTREISYELGRNYRCLRKLYIDPIGKNIGIGMNLLPIGVSMTAAYIAGTIEPFFEAPIRAITNKYNIENFD